MDSWVYLLIAIGIIVALIVIFFVSYYFNKKTPVPKGCENLTANEENCKACNNFECDLKRKFDHDENVKDSSKEEK